MTMVNNVPNNFAVEQALLGTLLSDPTCTVWHQISGKLKPDHFSEPLHARIYHAVVTLGAAGKIASPVTLINLFQTDGTLHEIGGVAYLSRLVALAGPAISITSHAELLRDLAARRDVIAVAADLTAAAQTVDLNQPFRLQLATSVEAMQRLFDDSAPRKTTYTLGEASVAMVSRITHIRDGKVDINTIKTGIGLIDGFIGGLHRGEYVIVGGRPSMGKTALACQLTYNVAERGGGVFYASLEMAQALLTPRLHSCHLWASGAASWVQYQRMLSGKVTEAEMRCIEASAGELASWPYVIDDAAGLTVAELEARAQVYKSKLERDGRTLDLVVVDHVHKMRHPNMPSKVNEYTEISGRLAEMAKRLHCPVVALAQLNRGVENRDDKRPQLADLRESGSIEQDADTVMFLYRPAYYLERKRCSDADKEADRMADLDHVKNTLEIIVEKQRSGPIGTLELWCDLAHNVVCDPADAVYHGGQP